MRVMFFDLDGTLLPLDQKVFMKHYFATLSAAVASVMPPEDLPGVVMHGLAAMMKNTDPQKTCEQVFIEDFERQTGLHWADCTAAFEAYYRERFDDIAVHFPADPRAAQAVQAARQAGYLCVLATNPVFPAIATYKRIAWAGLDPAWFSLVTTYEGCSFCKPNPAYFKTLMNTLQVSPEDCLMVGNDESEDIRCAQSLGIKTFFLTNTPIYMQGDSCTTPGDKGDYDALLAWIGQRG